MKKFISLLICLVLCFSLFTISAYATNIDLIQPDSTCVIIPNITNQEVPVVRIYQYDNQTVIIPTTINITPVEENQQQETTSNHISIKDEKIPTVGSLMQDIFELTNKERTAVNLNVLEYNDELQDAADQRAKEIAEQFSHTRPDGSSCHSIVKIEYDITGENIIKADNPIATAEKMMETWMNSQGHKDNILLADFVSMAVGVYVKDGVTYAIQIFIG